MKHELLVPVGEYASLIAAINNGADAVYLGGKKFGARAYANNFSYEELEKATKLCHLYGVKIYVTVNTLVYEREIDEALSYVRYLHSIGVDALIMQDVGLINLVHQKFPNLEIHASTQMHNHSEESLPFLETLGVKRVVFARELPLTYINSINTNLEKEVFIHGSLCISYSGQCLFSSHVLKRSGNRGECAGMCRLPYQIIENDKIVNTEGDYLLSPKDLCSINYFKELMDSNIKCFKIEGRMKSPLYVAIVTKIYKTLMTQYEHHEKMQVSRDDLNLLKAIFNREYTEGYLHNDNNIMNMKGPNHQGLSIGHVTNITKKKIEITLTYPLKQKDGIRFKKSNVGLTVNFMYDKNDNLINKGEKNTKVYLDNFLSLKEFDEVLLTNPFYELPKEVLKKIPVSLFFKAYLNEKMTITIKCVEDEILVISEDVVEKAISNAVSKERIQKCLEKVGNTPFIIQNIDIDINDGIFIPIGNINRLRKLAFDKLQTLRENKKKEFKEVEFKDEKIIQEKTTTLNVLARTKEQIEVLKELKLQNIIVENNDLWEENFIFKVPRDNLKHEYNKPNLLVTDYASMIKYPYNIGDYFLNITNHYTLNYLSKYNKMNCLSVEGNIEDYEEIIKNNESKLNVEVLIYGRIELMLLKYCLLNNLINKNKLCTVCQSNNKYYLVDRNKAKYPIINNNLNHSMIILSANNINLIKDIKRLKKIGITNYRIQLFNETKEEVKEIIEKVMSNL